MAFYEAGEKFVSSRFESYFKLPRISQMIAQELSMVQSGDTICSAWCLLNYALVCHTVMAEGLHFLKSMGGRHYNRPFDDFVWLMNQKNEMDSKGYLRVCKVCVCLCTEIRGKPRDTVRWGQSEWKFPFCVSVCLFVFITKWAWLTGPIMI